jgi:hypothetical protein
MAAAWFAAIVLLPLGHLANHRDDHVHNGFAIEYIMEPIASQHHVESSIPVSQPAHSHEQQESDDSPSHFGVLASATVAAAPEIRISPSLCDNIQASPLSSALNRDALRSESRAPPVSLT